MTDNSQHHTPSLSRSDPDYYGPQNMQLLHLELSTFLQEYWQRLDETTRYTTMWTTRSPVLHWHGHYLMTCDYYQRSDSFYCSWKTQPYVTAPVRFVLVSRTFTVIPLCHGLTLALYWDEWAIRKPRYFSYICNTLWFQFILGSYVIWSNEPSYHNDDLRYKINSYQ